MDVVSEIVSAQGGTTLASANEHPNPAWHHSITQFLIKPVAFALMLSLGTVQILPAHAQVIADPSAPKSQQPTVLPTASGATQINIQTPSAAGVSMNQYKQFDTQSNGTVLNNSRTNTNTQTAGWIQANPWLATGSARVIVNQVNSSNPSRLTGNIEVAGQRADLIIANPSGININGAAIINAKRTTFTTGAPQLNNGNLTGYQVNQGQINIEGTGLNTQGSDYTDLLARAVKVNAGIWANNLAITTGANNINATNDNITPNAATGTAPTIAIDTSALGGMYAGKITLIGTEKGVGVNNAGQIAASAGNVTIDANGMLSNSGTINSNGAENATQIKSTQLANTGSISSQGNTQIQTANLTNSGTIAAGREAKLTATDLNNSTGTINGQRIDITANSLNNTQGKIQQTGTQALALNAGSISNLNNGLIGYEPLDSGSGTGSTGTGTGSTGTGTTTPPSTATGGGSSTVVQPTPVVLADGQISVQTSLNNDAGRITANGGIDLTASNGLENHATLSLNKLTVTGDRLDNSSGTITSTQLTANTTNINNTAGKMGSMGNTALTSQTLDNTAGQITAGGTIKATVAQNLFNQTGVIASNGVLQINTGSLGNIQGTLSSVQDNVTINSQDVINNQSGHILSNKDSQIKSTQFDNTLGMVSAQNLSIDTQNGDFNNNQGQISANQTTINSGAFNNETGLLQATQALSVNTHGQDLTNINSGNHAGIISNGTLQLETGVLNNATGRISSSKDLTVHGAELDNTQGTIATAQNLELTLNTLTNSQGVITAGQNLNVTTEQMLNNDLGLMAATQAFNANASRISNTLGQMASVKANATIYSTHEINNQQGQISAQQTLNTYSTQLNNQQGQLMGQDLVINSTDLNNDAGLIQASQSLEIDTHQASLANIHSGNNAGIVSGGSLSIASGDLNNQTGFIGSSGDAQLNTQTINNQQGQIVTQSRLDLKSTTVNNTEGLIHVTDKGTLSANAIINSNTQNSDKGIQGSDLQINAVDLDNSTGAIRGDTLLDINATQHLNNTQGMISASQSLKVQGSSLEITNTQGTFNAGQSNRIQAQALTGDGQVLSQQDLMIDLSSDFNNKNKVQAGHDLTLNTTGTLNNDNILLAGNVNHIQAQNINNSEFAQIAGSQTEILSNGTTTNRGLIDGNNTYLKATTINNIGTGRIYGNHISVTAETLNNTDETIAGKNTAATIAARQQLDIGAQTINNREHATLYADGTLNIGGALDSNRRATGQANIINNASATIESTGDMNLTAQSINNTNEDFSVRWIDAPVSTQYIEEYALAGQPTHYTGGTWDRRSGEKNQQWAYYTTADGQVIPGEHWDIWKYDRNTYQQEVASSDPAKIIVGGNLTLSGGVLTNDKSQILVGGLLSDTGLEKVEQIAAEGQQRIETDGTYTFSSWKKGYYSGVKKRPRRYENTSDYTSLGSNPNVATVYSTLILPVTAYEQNQSIPASGVSTGSLNTGSGVQTVTGIEESSTPNLSTNTSIAPTTIASVQSVNATHPTLIKSGAVNTQMPNSSLFTVNPNNAGYYIQTDPRFANYRNWLSSDWMLNTLNLDPANMHKRLGDGYYEQKLIKEQIAQLTGRRYLGDYNNDDTQYQALMNAGVTFAGQYNLRPGVALTAEQMARLTSDMVWLVEQEVTLPNGTKATALVPKVYVAVKQGDIDGSGTLISANRINLNLTGDLNNAGTIAGRTVTQLSAENLNNLGGRITGNQIDLDAKHDINNLGGTIDAYTSASLIAGNDINIATTTRATQTTEKVNATTIDRVAGLYVGDGSAQTNATSLYVKAGNDVNLNGANVVNTGAGSSAIIAGNNLNLKTITTQNSEHIAQIDDQRTERHSTDIGSTIQVKGDALLKAGNDLNAKAATVNSDAGAVQTVAGHDINITVGQNLTHIDETHRNQTSDLISSSSKQMHDTLNSTESIASNFTGATVTMNAGNDLNVTGSNVVSDTQTTFTAGNDLNITAAQNTHSSTHFEQTKESGLMGTGGFGFMIGSKQNSTDADQTNTTNVASNVGSLNGDVNLSAGNHYQQTGSNVTAGHADATGQFVSAGDVNITAKDVDIVAGQDTYATDTVTKSKQSGLTVAVSVPIVSAVMAVADTAQTVGQSKNSRVNAMSAANTAMAGYQAANALSDLAKSGMDSVKDLNVSASITVGSSQSKSETHAKGTEAVASNVVGKNVNITATGAGKDSNIHVIGSEIAGTHATTLKADNNVTLESAQSISEEHSSNKSSGWNAGVAISYGQNGLAFGVTAGGNKGKGHGDGTSVTQVNSHVGSRGGNNLSTTTISAGGTTTLAGAQVLGNQVNIDTQNLAIESRQDTAKYDSKQTDMSGQVTVGYGFSASGSYSQNKINADYASVNEQSGILAGDGGYHISVKDHTDLKGGIVTSSQTAEDSGLNAFTTGTLTASNIQNYSSANADVQGYGLSSDNFTQGKYGIGKALVGNALNFGDKDESQSTVTYTAINTNNIQITDEIVQKNLTGQTAEQVLTSVNHDTANANHIVSKIDVEALKKDALVEQTFRNNVKVLTFEQSDLAYQAFTADKKILLQKCDANAANCHSEEIDPKNVKVIDGKAYVFNNGIFNDTVKALKNAAVQSTDEQNTQGVYVIINPETGSPVAELMYAGWDKLNEILGGALPISNASVANQDIINAVKAQGGVVDSTNHSRGSMTFVNGLGDMNRQGATNLPIGTATFNGAAANAQQAANLVEIVSGGKGAVQYATHQTDLVPKIVGGNPPTGGNANYGFPESHSSYGPNVEDGISDKAWGEGNHSVPVIVTPTNKATAP